MHFKAINLTMGGRQPATPERMQLFVLRVLAPGDLKVATGVFCLK